MQNYKCIVRVFDEVNCCIVNLQPDHIDYFYDIFSVLAPNYFFSPKYKLGVWDGKLHYFHKTGKTYTYLLESIIPRLTSLGYKITIDDKRTGKLVTPPNIDKDFFNNITDPRKNAPWEMRDYQVDMVNKLLELGYGVGIAGTGGGKTSICASIALSFERAGNLRSIIIVPDKNLTEQTHREYGFFGLDVGEYSGTTKDQSHMHVVSTWQSLQNNPQIVSDFQVVIVDECHGVRGNTLTKLLNEYGKNIVHRYGVTGTLPKEKSDIMSVEVALGPVRYTIPAHQLIEEGHLAEIHIDIMQLEVDLKRQYEAYVREGDSIFNNGKPLTYTQFKDSYFPDFQSEKKFLQQEDERLEWISHFIEAKADQKKGNVLCLVNGVNFGKKLAATIPNAVFIYGKDKVKERKVVYDAFKTNDNIIVIATVHIASTGLDIPRIFNLIYIDMGKSFIRTIQTLGRGLRKADDKDKVSATDICSDLKYSKKHIRDRIRFYQEAKYPYKKRVVDYSE